jgi:DMSO/TMAO reductase YedYZ molybdopterin-dependent catalytic subunit
MTEPLAPPPGEPGGPAEPARPGRRVVLTAAAGAAAGVALIGGAWWQARGPQPASSGTAGPAGPAGSVPPLPTPVSAASLPAGVEVGVDGVVPFRVDAEEFFQIDTTRGLPRIDAARWQLRIHGLVDRELTIDYASLLRRELVERDLTLCCVSNEVGGDLIGNAAWLGTPIAPLLREAGVRPEADMVLSRSSDGWTASTPLEALTDARDSLLAVGMNGEPLPARHGYPVRMVVPGLYGFVSATKWVVELKVTRFDADTAYWSTRGWSDHGPIKLSSRIDVPRYNATPRAGEVAVGGVAWAPGVGVRAVEVSVDGGPWQPARLGAAAGLDTWRQWVFTWSAAPGRHTLAVRATDAAGRVQTGDRAPVAPDGATGWHTIEVTVR